MTREPRLLRHPGLSPSLLRTIAAAGLFIAAASATAPVPALGHLATDAGELRVEANGALVIQPAAGVATSLAQLGRDGAAPTSARLRAVTTRAGADLVEVTARARSQSRVALVRLDGAIPTLLFVEPIGPNADGELTRSLEVTPEAIRRWQSTPAVARCDARPPLFLERYDLETKTWQREPLPRPAAPELVAATPPPLPIPRRALRFSSASTDGQSERADMLGAPRELDDGDAATTLALGSGVAAQGAFMTARAPREVELIGVRVVAPPAPSRLPTALVLIGGTPARVIARLAIGATPAGASRWFAMATPVRGACVSFVVDERAPGAEALAIAELELIAADDKAGGLEQLARQVAHDAPDAEGAAHSLEAAALPGAEAALAALGEATPTGHRRLLGVVRHNKGLLGPTHARTLGRVLETAHGDERAALLETLAAQPAAARIEAQRILADASQATEAHEDALELLGRIADDTVAAALLLDHLAMPDRAAARAALVHAARHSPTIVVESARRLVAAAAPISSSAIDPCADLLAVLRSAPIAPESAERVGDAIAALGPLEGLPFEVAARALSALGHVGGPRLTAAAAGVLHGSIDATLRMLAVSALREGAAARLLLASALTDGDARVRERALERLLGADPPPSPALLVPRTDDAWPQIRRLAYTGLARVCTTEVAPLLDRRVFGKSTEAEADARARAEALAAVAHCPGVSLERVAAALDPKQPAEVRERTAQVLVEVGGPGVLPLLSRELDRVYSRGTPQADSAVALLRAIGRVGKLRGSVPFDDETLRLLRDSAADPFYPSVRIAAMEALSAGCPDGAKIVFDRGDADPEPAVQRAAALGRQRCAR